MECEGSDKSICVSFESAKLLTTLNLATGERCFVATRYLAAFALPFTLKVFYIILKSFNSTYDFHVNSSIYMLLSNTITPKRNRNSGY